MSRNPQSPVAQGRVSWSPRLQLRLFSHGLEPSQQTGQRTLGQAARRVAPPVLPLRCQSEEAKRYLVLLCDWLEERLERPLKITRLPGNSRRITVFSSLTYTIRMDGRYIVSGKHVAGQDDTFSHPFEIGRPLESDAWLRPVLENLGIGASLQAELFFAGVDHEEVIQWLVATAYRLLLRQPAFQSLRRVGLPKAFALPHDLRAIALASRIRPVGPLLNSRTFNLVWHNERAFRLVARENPQLLPLLLAYIDQLPPGKPAQGKDPVAMLKAAVCSKGLSDATWRYVCHHGSRLFRVAWATATRQPAFNLAIRYLKALESAGLPPPPPPALARVLLHGYNVHDQDVPLVTINFYCGIDPLALRAGLLEADRARGCRDMMSFVEEFMGVCWWSEALTEPLDANQRKAPWSWFVRQWQAAETLHGRLEGALNRHWTTRSPGFVEGRWQVVPIRSEEELVRESLAMRNCLESLGDACASGEMEIYSIRDRTTGRRKACVGFKFDADGTPCIPEIKGFANTPVKSQFEELALDLFGELLNLAG